MSVIGSNILAGASGQGGGYNLDRSLRLRSSASATLSRTPATASNRKTWTWSAWVKVGALGTNPALFHSNFGSAPWTAILLQSNGTFELTYTAGTAVGSISSAVFRDPSAWYHFVWVTDTTQATASNRVKLYVNGVLQTFSSANYPSQNFDTTINNTVSHAIGGWSGQQFDGYLTEVNFIDGQALTPSSFGANSASTGVWQPKKYAGTYGTNGFYLPFTDNSALTTSSNVGLGKDFSGNGNFFATNNISITAGSTYDSMTDVPTLTSATAANYCVLNPLQKYSGLSSPTNGNLTIAGNNANWRTIFSTFAVTSGKWYCEVNMTTVSADAMIGVFNLNDTTNLNDMMTVDNRNLGRYSTGYGYQNNGNKVNNNTGSSYGATWGTGDVIGISLDMDSGTIAFSKNGTSQGTAFTSLSGLFSVGISTANGTFNPNFGQRPFTYTPPTGFVALNTFNLPTPTIGATASTQANKYFDINLWTGNDTSQTITNSGGFQPDFVWIKQRSSTNFHQLNDVVRGNTKYLYSNNTEAEETVTTRITSYNSNGFSLGSSVAVNSLGSSYVGWQWDAGGSTVTNTSGSISSQVRANTSAGFSVVTYTGNGTAGATVGHGLGVAPRMIIVKSRSLADPWAVYTATLGNTGTLYLNLTNSFTTVATWNNTTPTSSIFSVNAGGYYVNDNSATYVAYCFSEIAGYSKFGSYTGNGSADGTFVYTGFRPRYVMFKRTNTTEEWAIYDTSRDTYNVAETELFANSSSADYDGNRGIDFLSNGIKLRSAGGANNASGSTYIFMAFAENPFKYSNAR